MKAVSVSTQTKLDTAQGTDPIVVVQVGGNYYGDTDLEISPIQVQGKLQSISGLRSEIKSNNIGNFTSINFVLNDDDGSLKTWLDSTELDGLEVNLFHYFNGLTFSDMTLLFKGTIISPINWSEGERLLSLSAETKSQDLEVGFSTESTEIVKEARGQPWPLAFGNVIQVPALRIKRKFEATLTSVFKTDDTSFTVADSSEFTEFETYQVLIDDLVFEGEFSGNTFSITGGYNLPKYLNLATEDRSSHSADPDYLNYNVFWLTEFRTIINHYVEIQETGSTGWYQIVRQSGKKCWLHTPYKNAGEVAFIDGTQTLTEVAKRGRVGWETVLGPADNTAPIFSYGLIAAVPFQIPSGTKVVEWDLDKSDVYVCNLLEDTEIVAVQAPKDGGLIGIPSSYYTKDTSYAVAGQTVTALIFEQNLLDYSEQGWSEDVYVTMRSPIGPNTANIIEYLLDTYSTLSPDDYTFNTIVAPLLENYPSNFALLQKEDVISLVEKIAFQARCALVYEAFACKIIYLSTEPSSVLTVDESKIYNKSLNLYFKSREDVATRYTGTWKYSYYEDDRKIIYTNNQDKYGIIDREDDYFIYNIESLVQKSVNFWGNRFSKIWRKARFNNCSLDALPLELFDCIQYDPASLKAVVEKHEYDPENNTVNLEVELPSVAGSTVQDSLYWISDPEGDPGDPTAGYSEVGDLDLQEASTNYIIGGNVAQKQEDTVPAIVVAVSPVIRADLYADGLANPATTLNQQVTSLNVDAPAIGDRGLAVTNKGAVTFQSTNAANRLVKVLSNSGTDYTVIEYDYPGGATVGVSFIAKDINGSQETLTDKYFFVVNKNSTPYFEAFNPIKLVKVISNSSTTYTVQEYDTPGGSTIGSTFSAFDINGGSDSLTNKYFFLFKKGANYYFEAPAASTGSKLIKILSNSGITYTVQEYDAPGGSTIGSSFEAYELNFEDADLTGLYFWATLNSNDGFYYFFYPVTACS